MKLPATIKVGDLIAFWGSKANLLSAIIEDVTHGGPSHVAVVNQLIPFVSIIQSTIEGVKNGIQVESLVSVMYSYSTDSHIALYPLNSPLKADQLFQFYKWTGAALDHVQYGIFDLVTFLTPHLQNLGLGNNPHYEVCSVAAASLYVASGVLPSDLEVWKQTPAKIIKQPIFGTPSWLV
jgi:hypothetical protein